LIEYSLAGPTGKSQGGNQPAGAPVWSRDFLQPLAPGALTPFSASVLHEMAGRSWYNYFDRLGFDPTPKSRVVRSLHGRPYFTLTLSAQLDAQQAGIEPPALHIGGAARRIARWEKPGLLAGLKRHGNARKVASALQALDGEIDGAAVKGQAWLQRVQAMRWSQAEILQIMEEIERVGASTLELYVAARHNLQSAYLRLLGLLDGVASLQQLAALNLALRPSGDLVELQIARSVVGLAQAARAEQSVLHFLVAGDFSAWETQLAEGPFLAGLRQLLAEHGHRCAGEGELMNPRWSENPASLLTAVAAAARSHSTLPSQAAPDDGPLAGLLDARRRKEAQTLVAQARRCLALQSKALHVHAYTLAGTRIWAKAAGHEAMGDKRLLDENDVFFYELEEMKQMMTGEWNISDTENIRATAVQRKLDYQNWQRAETGDLLIGDCTAFAVMPSGALGLPGAAGTGRGEVVTAPAGLAEPALRTAKGKVVLVGVQADAGWAATLPAAAGIVQAQGSPLDPVVAAAAALHIPVLYGLGERLAEVQAQPTVAIDGSQGAVVNGR
jgi:phosphohistidine swiveling domain-containing protein